MFKELSYEKNLRLLPLFLFLFLLLSLYFIYVYWGKYQNSTRVTTAIEETSKIQKIQNNIINEILCVPSLTTTSSTIAKKCELRKKSTDSLLSELDGNRFESFLLHTKEMREGLDDINISDLGNYMQTQSAMKVSDESRLYLTALERKTDKSPDKKILKDYASLSNVLMSSRLEKVLLNYYILFKEEISASNYILWSQLIDETTVEEFDESIKQKIDENVTTKIADIRMSMLMQGASTNPSDEHKEWLKTYKKREKSIENTLSKLSEDVSSSSGSDKKSSLLWLALFSFMSLLALFSIYNIIKKIRKQKEEDNALYGVVDKLNDFSVYTKEEEQNMYNMLHEDKSKMSIYKYMHTNLDRILNKQKKTEENTQSKEDFIATVSHEIRTPLSSIIGFVKLIKKMGTTRDQDEFLTLIEASSDNLISVVNDVLDVSKLDANKSKLAYKSFDIFDTVQKTVSSFIQQADQKDIELGIFVDPFLPERFMGDAGKLSQVLTNLIGNAIKFTDIYGNVNVFVQCVHQDGNSAKVLFSVEDNGIGLTHAEQEHIFDAYVQASDNTETKYGGTGLGLNISSKIIELMGSSIEVKSMKDNGSKFFFTISLDVDKDHKAKTHPEFSDVTLGMALPVRSINRQLDTNLEMYTRYLGANFKFYYYDELFESKKVVDLPDVMVFDHHYARLEGELEQCASIACETVLLTNGSLRERVNADKKQFSDIIFAPINLLKTIGILEKTRKKDVHIKTNPYEDIGQFKGMKVLFAEDNSINRTFSKTLLEKLGFSVTVAFDGYDAFSRYKESTYDIVLMDIEMPIMDGIESTRNIIEYELENGLRHTPIIALSELHTLEDNEKYIADGLDDYIIKPLDAELVKRVVMKYCIEYRSH